MTKPKTEAVRLDKETEAVRLDKETREWFAHPRRVAIETTLMKCDQCGLFYKPELGHKCKVKKVDA